MPHLQFLDDTFVIGKKSWENMFVIKAIFQIFELVLRLKVNFHKSGLVGVGCAKQLCL